MCSCLSVYILQVYVEKMNLSSIFLCTALIYLNHLSAMADNNLKINFCDTVDLLALPDVGKKTA